MCNLILIVIHCTRQVSSFRLHWATTSPIFMICAQRIRLGIKLKLFRSQHLRDHGTGKRHRTKQHPPRPLLRHLKQLTQKQILPPTFHGIFPALQAPLDCVVFPACSSGYKTESCSNNSFSASRHNLLFSLSILAREKGFLGPWPPRKGL